jgi:hypothetical protein
VDGADPSVLTEALLSRYFEPSLDWQLFEVVVALRIARALEAVSVKRQRSRLLVGGSRGPYAQYVLPDGTIVRLWYQSWPPSSAQSLHRRIRHHYSIDGSDARPDIVIERLSVPPAGLLLELKASRSSSYLSEGLLQLLGYLKDRPDLFTARPGAWLVAPASKSFEGKSPGDLEIWVVSSDDVAGAVVSRMLASA